MNIKKVFLGALIMWSITIVLSYLLVGSLNPIQIFYSNAGMFSKMVMGILLFISVLNFFSLVNIILFSLMQKTSYGEKICPICNQNLIQFIPVYGNPIFCYTCLSKRKVTQYHEKCYRAIPKCPECEKNNPFSDIES